MKIEVTNIEFDSMETFIQWKEDIESSTHSSYVLKYAPTISNEAKIWYYYCNRAGVYKLDGKGKHQLKTQDTAKIGCQCTAHLRVSQHLLTQKISVRYCPTHYNHDLNFGNFPLESAVLSFLFLELLLLVISPAEDYLLDSQAH